MSEKLVSIGHAVGMAVRSSHQDRASGNYLWPLFLFTTSLDRPKLHNLLAGLGWAHDWLHAQLTQASPNGPPADVLQELLHLVKSWDHATAQRLHALDLKASA